MSFFQNMMPSLKKQVPNQQYQDQAPLDYPNLNAVAGEGSLKRIINNAKSTENAEAPSTVASVVVTTCKHGSYDTLFRSMPQQSEYGKISIFLMDPGSIMASLQEALDGKDIDAMTLSESNKATLKELVADCATVGSDAVCFNFECCGGFSDSGFGGAAENALFMKFIAFLVKDYGCMTMFGDFSLKALIGSWDEKLLGKKPFVKTGEFSSHLKLAFNAEVLKKSPSAQLNTVGSISEEKDGKATATLHAMGGTIHYTVNKFGSDMAAETDKMNAKFKGVEPLKRDYATPYELQVLTVAEMLDSESMTQQEEKKVANDRNKALCEVICDAKKPIRGLAGHVLLTFPPSARNIAKFKSDLLEEEAARQKAIEEKKIEVDVKPEDDELSPARGMILTSCGHWIELMKIDVNMERLLETVREDYGATNAVFTNMQSNIGSLSGAAQAMQMNTEAVGYMQSRTPAKFNKNLVRMKKKGY